MNKKIALLSGILVAGVSLVLVVVVQAVVTPTSGTNFVNVTSCQQVGSHIKIRRGNGPEYTLLSTCRNAGHGLRQYALSCVSGTKYKVQWQSCTTPTDTAAPVVTLSTELTGSASAGYGYKLHIYADDAQNNIKAVQVTKIEVGTAISSSDWIDGIMST